MGVHPAEDDNAAKARKYTVFLILFNLFLLCLGVGTIYLGVEGVDTEFEELTEELIGSSFFTIAIACGAFAVAVAIIGFLATKWTGVGNCSAMMWVYGILILVCFALITAVFLGSIFLFQYLNSQTLDGYNPESSFDSQIVNLLEEYTDEWIIAQDHLDCCGWGTEASLETGAACGNTNPDYEVQNCRSLLIVEYLDEIQILTLVSLVVFIMVAMVLVSIVCLRCMKKFEKADDEAILKKAKRYQWFLLFFNIMLFVMGAGTLYMATGGDPSDFEALSEEFLGGSYFTLAVCVAIFLFLVSFFGCYSSYSGRQSLGSGTCSKTLWAYGFVVFVLTILVLVVFGGSIYAYNLLNDEATSGYNATHPSYFDAGVFLAIETYPDQWVDAQDYVECCGYASVTEFATGSFCEPDENGLIGPDCRALLLGEYVDDLYIFTIVMLVGFIFVFMACAAIVGLGCLQKLEYTEAAQTEPEPADYQ